MTQVVCEPLEKIEIITVMNINKLVAAGALMVALALSTSSAMAITAAQVKSTKEAVLSVPVPEMPAKAAEVVLAATDKEREAIAVTAVKAIVFKHRASAPVVVAAVSKVAPEVAAAITAAAAELANDQASIIARAAIKAAPGQSASVNSVLAKFEPATVAPQIRASAGPVATGGTVVIATGKAIDGTDLTSNPVISAPTPTPKDYTQPR